MFGKSWVNIFYLVIILIIKIYVGIGCIMYLDKLLYMWIMYYMYIIKDSLLEIVYLEKGWNKKKIRFVFFFLFKMYN